MSARSGNTTAAFCRCARIIWSILSPARRRRGGRKEPQQQQRKRDDDDGQPGALDKLGEQDDQERRPGGQRAQPVDPQTDPIGVAPTFASPMRGAADGIAMLFTEDAVWESPGLGRFEGREAIRGFFRGASGIFSFAIHYSLNGHIEVDGDFARARWYMFRNARRS